MTKLTSALIAVFGMGCAAVSVAQVTLDAQALEAVEKANPDHFRRLSEVVRVATEEGCASAEEILWARFEICDAYCSPDVILPSLPPKQRITFTMEDTPYTIYIPVHTADTSGAARASQAAPKRNNELPPSPAHIRDTLEKLNSLARCMQRALSPR